MKYLKLSFFVALLLFPTSSQASELAVAGGGEVVGLISGSYGDLFPGGSEADPAAEVLALDIVGGQQERRVLVPSSSDASPEYSPSLYHDPAVDITYVLWSSRHNGVHPYLRLAQYSDETWGETFDITGSVFAVKNEPQLSVHHEGWTSHEGRRVERTVFHVFWWEQASDQIEARFSALVLENGVLVGETGIQTLSDFVQTDFDFSAEQKSLGSNVRVVDTDAGVLVGFVNKGGVRIASSESLPASLSRLGLAVETAIAEFDPEGSVPLGERIVETMLAFESEFHPATLSALIDSVLRLVEEDFASSDALLEEILRSLTAKAMPYIVEIGARMKSGGLIGDVASVLAVRPDPKFESAQPHHLAVGMVREFGLPDDIPSSGVQLFISKRGTAALLAWDEGETVAYRETTADGWTDVNVLDVTKGIDRETAYRILEERTLER